MHWNDFFERNILQISFDTEKLCKYIAYSFNIENQYQIFTREIHKNRSFKEKHLANYIHIICHSNVISMIYEANISKLSLFRLIITCRWGGVSSNWRWRASRLSLISVLHLLENSTLFIGWITLLTDLFSAVSYISQIWNDLKPIWRSEKLLLAFINVFYIDRLIFVVLYKDNFCKMEVW